MSTIHNEIIINAPVERIWNILGTPDLLEKYDPTIKNSVLVSNEKTGLGAKRKINMLDGKNWFEEKITVFNPTNSMTYELTACSFPIKSLKHTYNLEKVGNGVRVKQKMEYEVKFGLLGKLMDKLMMRKQFDSGIKKFFSGLKLFAEKN